MPYRMVGTVPILRHKPRDMGGYYVTMLPSFELAPEVFEARVAEIFEAQAAVRSIARETPAAAYYVGSPHHEKGYVAGTARDANIRDGGGVLGNIVGLVTRPFWGRDLNRFGRRWKEVGVYVKV